MKHMKQIILAAAIAALGGSAFAGSSSTTINIGGEIGSSCTIAADPLNLGQITSFDYYMSTHIPAGLGVNVNCSAGTAYSLSVATSDITTYMGGLKAILAGGTQAKANGVAFPIAGTGTGAEQYYAVTGMRLVVRTNDGGSSVANPTGGIVNGTFAGVFTVTY